MNKPILFLWMTFIALSSSLAQPDYSPKPDERQLPTAMHSKMETLPSISVGMKDADITGKDNRALQAAVDYIAALGGGTVLIKEGDYLMNDSLHLRPNVTVRGEGEKTILRKSNAAVSNLAIDGDFGEEQITVENPDGFEVGYGVAIWDKNAGGFHTTVARITGKRGNTVSISKPLMSDCMIHNGAAAATVFPVVSGYHLENARIENVTIEGNKEDNPYLTGCRGAGIFLYRGFGTVISQCITRNYNGDGISFQQSNDVHVSNCISEGNTKLGLHPGSGSQRPVVMNNIAKNNGTDGLFLCWRVRHGLFEKNVLENNGQFGISIGHKDSDNVLQQNIVRANGLNGVFFRNETLGMAGHRNTLSNNIIENNGVREPSAGIRVRGETNGLIFKNNTIRDTREGNQVTQKVGIKIEESAGEITLQDNTIVAETSVQDSRNQ